MTIRDNLFGEKTISIKGDTKLNFIANQIFNLIENDENNTIVEKNRNILIGEIGEINRKIHWAILTDSGFLPLLREGDISKIKAWYLSKEYPTEEETARALREMISEGFYSLTRKATLIAEKYRQNIARKMR